MARRNQVASLFGATPQQIMEQQAREQAQMVQQIRDPYQQVGTAIGVGLGRLFGGESEEVTQARQMQEALQGVNPEDPAQLRELARTVQAFAPERSLQLLDRADQIEANALGMRKAKADLALTEARTADLLKEDVSQAEYRDTNVLAPDGSMIRGTRKDGVLYITDSQTSEEIKAPPNYLLISDTVDPRGQITEQGLRASTFIVKNTPYYKQYESVFGDDKEAQNALVAEFTRLRLDNRNQNVPTNTLVRQAALFNAGKLKEVTRDGVTYLVDITNPSKPVTLRRK